MGNQLRQTFSFRAKVISIVDQEVIDWSRLSAFNADSLEPSRGTRKRFGVLRSTSVSAVPLIELFLS
ncbi:MAG TPA: hypothetical protein DDX19_10385 [Rhodopirellula baltica]|nr:hypothetical protein [Rhodopirellula baltica]